MNGVPQDSIDEGFLNLIAGKISEDTGIPRENIDVLVSNQVSKRRLLQNEIELHIWVIPSDTDDVEELKTFVNDVFSGDSLDALTVVLNEYIGGGLTVDMIRIDMKWSEASSLLIANPVILGVTIGVCIVGATAAVLGILFGLKVIRVNTKKIQMRKIYTPLRKENSDITL